MMNLKFIQRKKDRGIAKQITALLFMGKAPCTPWDGLSDKLSCLCPLRPSQQQEWTLSSFGFSRRAN
jgi:hypothetical protein